MKKLAYIIRILPVAVALMAFSLSSSAQGRFSVGTNTIGWLDLVTMNINGGYAVGQHISLQADVRVNPWVFRKGDPEVRYEDPVGDGERQFQNKKQSYSFGIRWWPWHINSGFWLTARGQYMEYDCGGFFSHPREAGDAVGLVFGGGYTYMLSANWNIEFGVEGWSGYTWYGKYLCTNCGRRTERGGKLFLLPNDVLVSIVYVF